MRPNSARPFHVARPPASGEADPAVAANASSTVDLPGGTITFLLTDVENSTRLWTAFPLEMVDALPRHEDIVRAAIAQYGGVLVRRGLEGDSHFAVFMRATDAVASAAAIQLALEREPWPMTEPLRVHLGIHTGQAQLRDGGYYGSAVNRCARLRKLSHGGQVLLSGASYDMVNDSIEGWPSGTVPRALGELQLDGLAGTERVYQLVIEGVSLEFPPLVTSTETPPNNLPAELTSFVGREDELAELERLILQKDVHLVTVAGPGGVGKTRLALRLAGNLLGAFPDGVYHVSLAAVTAPDLVAQAIQHALGLFDRSSRTALDTLIDRLRQQRVLLVLDNFEQLIEAGAEVTRLMRACPGLKVLVTSRAVLRVSGEHVYELAPFALPKDDAPIDDLRKDAAVRLFMDRASSARAAISVSANGLRRVADVCRKLDGLPLAIELIAARARTISIESLNSHLADARLALTVDGPRDAPPRHHTLRAAIDWSFALLAPVEQHLAARLSVFTTACTADQARAVCLLTGEFLDVDVVLTSLVDKSLLRVVEDRDGSSRFEMLQTIREYASEKLAASSEADLIHRQHADVFYTLLREVARQRGGPSEAEWLRRLASEQENLRAAIVWAIAKREVDLALNIADTIWWFLFTYGLTQEGIRLMRDVLQLSEGQLTPLRARVLVGAGRLAFQGGDGPAAEVFLHEALTIARTTGDLQLLDLALGGLSFVVFGRGAFAQGIALAEENVQVALRTGDHASIAHAHVRLAEHLVLNRDLDRGFPEAETAVRETADLGDGSYPAALDTLGLALRLASRPAAAVEVLERAVELHRDFGYRANLAEALFRLADARMALADTAGATRACWEGLTAAHKSGSQRRVATGLRVAAALATRRGDLTHAHRLLAAAVRIYNELAPNIIPVDLADVGDVQLRLLAGNDKRGGGAAMTALGHGSIDDITREELDALAAFERKGFP